MKPLILFSRELFGFVNPKLTESEPGVCSTCFAQQATAKNLIWIKTNRWHSKTVHKQSVCPLFNMLAIIQLKLLTIQSLLKFLNGGEKDMELFLTKFQLNIVKNKIRLNMLVYDIYLFFRNALNKKIIKKKHSASPCPPHSLWCVKAAEALCLKPQAACRKKDHKITDGSICVSTTGRPVCPFIKRKCRLLI